MQVAPALILSGVLINLYFVYNGHFLWDLTLLSVIAGLAIVAANVLSLLEKANEGLWLTVCAVFAYPLYSSLGSPTTGLTGKGEMLYCLGGFATSLGIASSLLDRAMERAVRRHEAVDNRPPS